MAELCRKIDYDYCIKDELGGLHEDGLGWSPLGYFCGECSKITCKDCPMKDAPPNIVYRPYISDSGKIIAVRVENFGIGSNFDYYRFFKDKRNHCTVQFQTIEEAESWIDNFEYCFI